MRKVNIKRSDGNEDCINCYTVKEFPWINMPEALINCKHTKHPTNYFKMFATFDIETTTIVPDNADIAPYGFMYHWQMCIGGVVVYGRRWEEWIYLIERIVDWLKVDIDTRLVIYVHNLSYEYQFIKNIIAENFGGASVFASTKRKPIKVSCNNGIEFRCSYFLSNMSLAKAVENEKGTLHPKAVGDLDYKIKRTANTELDDTEFAYTIVDVVALYEFISCRLKNEHDNLESIPLTSTGYVRRDCRNATRRENGYRDLFYKNRMNKDVYLLLKEAGRGGNTHANRYMSGRIWHDVDSYDVASSYPAQMLLKKYPCRSFTYYGQIDTYDEMLELIDNNACLFRIIFDDLKVNTDTTMPYITLSKAIGKGTNLKYDNGRILSADALALTLTDIDWKIIKEQYSWSQIAVSDFYFSKYDYLPESLRGQVLEYFKLKTELKDKIKHETDAAKKEDYQYLYAKSKNRLNGIFGMAYTDPVRDVILVDENLEWIVEEPDIEEALFKYYKSRNSFLVYAWGVWITAHARAHLQALLDATGDGTIYCDTDSSKAVAVSREAIEKLNTNIKSECDKLGAYVDYNGCRYYLGVYELETPTPYKEFKTLGAKKYVYTDEDGLHVTISGVNKKLGSKELKDIKNFRPGFIFKDAGGSTLYYNDVSQSYYITIDGCTMLTGSNIGMVDSTYEIGITGEYAELIGYNIYKDL